MNKRLEIRNSGQNKFKITLAGQTVINWGVDPQCTLRHLKLRTGNLLTSILKSIHWRRGDRGPLKPIP